MLLEDICRQADELAIQDDAFVAIEYGGTIRKLRVDRVDDILLLSPPIEWKVQKAADILGCTYEETEENSPFVEMARADYFHIKDSPCSLMIGDDGSHLFNCLSVTSSTLIRMFMDGRRS